MPPKARSDRGRFSAKRKREAVLRLIRGEALDLVSRELGVPRPRDLRDLSGWQPDLSRLPKAGEGRLLGRECPGGNRGLEGSGVPHGVRFSIALASAAVALVTAGCSASAQPPGPSEARAFYTSQPPHLSPVVLGTDVPEGLADVRASTCGACHHEIYAEWKLSTHAHAWLDDAQFQAELHKPRPNGGDVQWMCVNCHTPMEAQLPRLVVGLEDGRLDKPIYVDNPAYDEVLQREAITCATCHVKDGVVLGPFGDTAAPHATKRSEHLLSEAVCARCHQAEAEFPELVLACSFGTGREYASSLQAKEGAVCQTCHMPEVTRSIFPGMPERKTRRHWFGGSLIPKRPEDEAGLAPLRKIYPDGLTARFDSVPPRVSPGSEVVVQVEYRNANAGHRLPTGDPERFILLDLVARDAEGTLLGSVNERIGTVFQWYPDIQKLSDNRLEPGEARKLRLVLTAPASGRVELELRASKWRISQESLEYHELVGRYPPSREFLVEHATIRVGAGHEER